MILLRVVWGVICMEDVFVSESLAGRLRVMSAVLLEGGVGGTRDGGIVVADDDVDIGCCCCCCCGSGDDNGSAWAVLNVKEESCEDDEGVGDGGSGDGGSGDAG